MILVNVSKERQEELRVHHYTAIELECRSGSAPPQIGTYITGFLLEDGCGCSLQVVSVRPSRRLKDTYLVLLKLKND
jgi:hypothetical protein